MPKTTKRDLLATLAGLPDDAELGGTVTRNGETLWGKSDPTMQEGSGLVQDPKEVLENDSGDSFAATGTAAGTGEAAPKAGSDSAVQPNNSGQENLGTEQGSGSIQTQDSGSALPTEPQPDVGGEAKPKNDPFAGLK